MSCGYCPNCTIGCVSGCNVECEKKQNFCGGCSGESQQASHYFSFTDGSLGKDDIIVKGFNSSVLDSWGKYVEDAANKGDEQDSGGWTWKGADVPFLHASDIQELVDGLNSLGGGTSASFGKGKDDVIYGSLLEAIQEALHNLKLNPLACDKCNTACDNPEGAICNTCQHCLGCQPDNSWSGSW